MPFSWLWRQLKWLPVSLSQCGRKTGSWNSGRSCFESSLACLRKFIIVLVSVFVYVCAQSYLTLCGPMNVVHQAPLFMGFLRQESQSGLPFPIPGDHPNPEIEPESLAFSILADGFFTIKPPVIASNWRHPKHIAIGKNKWVIVCWNTVQSLKRRRWIFMY